VRPAIAPGGLLLVERNSARRFWYCVAPRRAHAKPTQEGTAISQTRTPENRVNERIRVPQVRVIGEDGEQVGVLATRDALEMARARGLDLVEVAPNVRPPVCRILDYGKYKYEQNRRARKAKKKQHQMQLKEVKMRPKIEDHDYGFKVQHAREFLEDRDKVKLTVMFRGREMAHPELGHRLIQKVIAALDDIALVESSPRSEGRTLTAVLSPRPAKTGGSAKASGESEGKPAAAKPVAAKPAAAKPAGPRAASPKTASAKARKTTSDAGNASDSGATSATQE
jgi:translation initiation factor IF-3